MNTGRRLTEGGNSEGISTSFEVSRLQKIREMLGNLGLPEDLAHVVRLREDVPENGVFVAGKSNPVAMLNEDNDLARRMTALEEYTLESISTRGG